jgi:hypothetical protein
MQVRWIPSKKPSKKRTTNVPFVADSESQAGRIRYTFSDLIFSNQNKRSPIIRMPPGAFFALQ